MAEDLVELIGLTGRAITGATDRLEAAGLSASKLSSTTRPEPGTAQTTTVTPCNSVNEPQGDRPGRDHLHTREPGEEGAYR